ncbi:response regulator [Ramlibacter albus]|uniref:Response regulator n=1 Tax=Ramlibacter albus TaxID=2079448 RepID=A0A923S856_9BURK|nr:response regulator [Ramlibacter albus]MBC5767767.1 response regulator [Ramlibacter albus]
MSRRVFIKVVGFSDVERHALNTVFRLSEERDTAYTLWAPEAPTKPELALLDGLTYEARLEAESPANRKLSIVWVGDDAPANTWRVFQRPIVWTEVVQAMDQLFAPADLDFDLEIGGSDEAPDNGPDTQPSQLEEPGKRALIASPDLNDRLYYRAKLALARMPIADEAETAAQALELLRSNAYQVALVDFALPGGAGWAFVRQLKAGDHPVPHVIVTMADASLPERFRAKLAGATALFPKPPDPEKLGEALDRV